MYIQQLYTHCLAQAAYYIESNGEAAIIDPLRDTSDYISLLKSRNAKLKYIFETHFHADFISGHLDLAKQTGAQIIFGPDAKPNYDARICRDNEKMLLGDCVLQVLHTPGHTIESICVLLFDEQQKPHSLFSGDTLFVGDVGRPDLLSGDLKKEALAGMLYDSIQKKILPLNDEIILYPGHGAGSACGKNLGKETTSTIGIQKKVNFALQQITKENFIHLVTTAQPQAPAYFLKDAAINKNGYENFETILGNSMNDLSAEQVVNQTKNGALILDVRGNSLYAKAHVKGSIHIALDGSLAIYAGSLISLSQPIILICELAKEVESITRLVRVGFENIVGYWDGDLHNLQQKGIEISHTKTADGNTINELLENDDLMILDVRNRNEFSSYHLKNSINIPILELQNMIDDLDPQSEYLIYCASGYRSMIAASLLEKNRFRNIINLSGGIDKLKQTTIFSDLILD
jgi:hydroxyacylglutathione hydrolase